MSGRNPLLAAELERYDWSAHRSFLGGAERLPDAVERLASAESAQEADVAWSEIDSVALVQGRLSECALPLTSCLVAGLEGAGTEGRRRMFDLLATIAGGYDDHVDIALVGPVSVRECVRRMTDRLGLFAADLKAHGNPSCVDVLLMCGVYDASARDHVSDVFREALALRSCAGITDLIEASLADLHE
ncbi:hypothetical protein GTW40_13125 [Streptomyces sp. SID4985]|uniref:hypothetical protein n=1 Tax=Streptomyces sp. SID4985 TaxID=2690292 RepID=UPI00136AFFD8|nr:hypothetical protein [Streptomyces sp. SID4985]MYQ45991.1 hypothetical protein [Streptomyces sp. SID4985]